MSASNYLENALLDHLFGKSTYASPTTIYVALLTDAPDETGTAGSDFTEADYTSYARVSTTDSDWNSASGGSLTNGNAITFPACTGGSSTVTHFALLDQAQNLLVTGALDSSLAVSNGITPEFAASALTCTLD